MIKRNLLLLLTAVTLTGCAGTSPEPVSVASFNPPIDCNSTTILAALPQDLPSPVYIPTEWQPAAGTDLEAILSNNGIACTYGVQQAEAGAFVAWTKDTAGLFQSRVAGWERDGFVEATIAGVDVDKLYVISDAAMNAREIHSWNANMLVNGYWIQLSASYIYERSEAQSLINAAITSLQP